MTLAELKSRTPAERWRGLAHDAQERIGAKLLEHHFAQLVADDDGTETSEADRLEAMRVADLAFDELFRVVEGEFPGICWVYPEGTTYEARDRFGHVIGMIEDVGAEYRFVPTSPRIKRGKVTKYGLPVDAIPPWARRIIANGGWFGAVLPNDEPMKHAA